MNIDKLDKEVRRILSQEDGTRTYSEIRKKLIENGYSQQEMDYIMGIVDEKLLTSIDKGDQKRAAVRNMIIGAVMAIVAFTLISASYFGSMAPKEVYYVSLVVFAVGYLVFRKGFRRRGSGNRGNEGSS